MGNGYQRAQEVSVFCVFMVMVVGLLWIWFLLVSLSRRLGSEIGHIAGGGWFQSGWAAI